MTHPDRLTRKLVFAALLGCFMGRVALAQSTDPDRRAAATEAQMTDDERFAMIYSIMGAATIIGMTPDPRLPAGIPMSAGYVRGVPRLGVPAQLQTDASMGVTNSGPRAGADVPQLYLTRAPDGQRMRLLALEMVVLEPGESKAVTLTGDPRLLGRYDEEPREGGAQRATTTSWSANRPASRCSRDEHA